MLQAEGVCGQLSHLNRQMVMNFLSLSSIYVPVQSSEAVNRLKSLTLKFSSGLIVKTFIGVVGFVQSRLTLHHSWPFLLFDGITGFSKLQMCWMYTCTQ